MSAVLRPNPPIPSDAELALLESDAIAAAWGGDVIALANADPNEVDAVGRRAIWRHGCDAGMIAPPTNVATPSDPHSAEAPVWRDAWRTFQDPYLGPDTEKFPSPFESFVAGYIAAVRSRDAEVAELKAKIADTWDESCKGLAWCMDNGADNLQDIIAYVTANNPYRAELRAVSPETAEDAAVVADMKALVDQAWAVSPTENGEQE